MNINKKMANSIVVGMIASQIVASANASEDSKINTDTSSLDSLNKDDNANLKSDDKVLVDTDEYLVYDEPVDTDKENLSLPLEVVPNKIKSVFKQNNILLNEENPSDESEGNKEILDKEFDLSIYPESIANELALCINMINEYEKSEDKNISDLRDIIDIFYLIPTVIEDSFPYEVLEWDAFDFIFYYIRDEIYSIEDIEKEQSDELIYFTEKIFLGWRKAKTDGYWYRVEYLRKGLYEYNKDKNINAQPRIKYLKFLSDYFFEYEDYEYLSDKIPVIDIPNKDIVPPLVAPPSVEIQDKNPIGSNSSNNNNNNNSNSNTILNNKTGYITHYKKIGNRCIKVKSLYKDGKLISSTENSIPKSQYPKCGIYTYVHNIKYEKNRIEINRDYIENNQNSNSNFSIYYTLNKKSKTPYYYDTGIKTSSSDNSVAFNQLVDALYQVAIKMEGFSMDDNDKSLIVIEGKPIVVKNDKKTYSKSYVEELLDSFENVELKIMESSQGKTYTVENYLTDGKLDVLSLDGYDIKLSTSLKLENEKVMSSIQEIFTYMKANVKFNNGKLIIELNDDVIIVNVDSNKYTYNGKSYTFKNKPQIEDGSVIAELETLLNHIGYSLVWDSDFGKMIIDKK